MNKEEWMKKFRRAETVEKSASIVELCRGKNVLDVGCVGQDKSYESDSWLHARIKAVAGRLIGSDIDEKGIAALNGKGYTVYTPEQLTGNNFQQTFDVIVMGDVIEHVNNPVEFLQFYKSFLAKGGQMIICTPNVFGARYSLQVFLYGNAGTNPEHTFGFEPYTMLELFTRARVTPQKFHWLKEYGKPANFQQRVIRLYASVKIWFRRYFSANFMFVVTDADDPR